MMMDTAGITQPVPDGPRESAAYINMAASCCEDPSDKADDIRRETTVETEKISCDNPSDKEKGIKREKIVKMKGSKKRRLRFVVVEKYKNRLKSWYKAKCNQHAPLLERIAKTMPVIMGAIALSLMVVDQSTDAVSTYEICNIQCKCVWWENSRGVCSISESSRTETHPCVTAFSNYSSALNYCTPAWNQIECNQINSWDPETYRHPSFCLSSILTILVPSIINSTYLLTSLWVLYPSVLRYMELPDTSRHINFFIKITLLVLYTLQLLPFAWLALNFLINLMALRNGFVQGLVEKEKRENTSKRSKLIFSILEDTPQLIFHCMLIINTVIKDDNPAFYAGIDNLHIGSYLGATSSAVSIALTLTLFIGSSSYKATAIQFAATALSVGTRAIVCASYASAIEGFYPLTWPLALPAITAIGLFIIEYIVLYFYKCVMYSRSYTVMDITSLGENGIVENIREHIHSFYEWVTSSNFNDCITNILKNLEKCLILIVSLICSAHTAQSLITSYTYLVFAVALNAASLSGWSTTTGESMTQYFFIVIQYLAFSSLLLNILIVQWKGKDKVCCLLYSLVFLFFIWGIYMLARDDFKTFYSFYTFIKDHYPSKNEEKSIFYIFYVVLTAGVIAIINLLILIISLIGDHC